jgi:hypothetical protein
MTSEDATELKKYRRELIILLAICICGIVCLYAIAILVKHYRCDSHENTLLALNLTKEWCYVN